VDVFTDRPHAYVKLWKHHSAQPQADRINELAARRQERWLTRYGGFISAEWEFAKALELYENDRELYEAMDYWVEAADWIVWQLTGTCSRNACSAGYKGILQDGAYPSDEYLDALAPGFGSFVHDKLDQELVDLGSRAGSLSAEAATWTGLPVGIAVAAGNVDAHVTAPAAQAVNPGQMVAIMGTSTCHVISSHRLEHVSGMCGVVDGGIIHGLYGYEAGQSGVGDIFGWFVDTQVPAEYVEAAERAGKSVHEHLTDLAAAQEVGEHGLLALDWHSGNRSVLVDHDLSGLVVGLTLATKPEDQYRALLEATAFGTRVIVEAFGDSGVPVEEFIVAGGLVKNELLTQIYADVLGMPLSVIASRHGPALGSAIHAAVAAGAYADVAAASEAMGGRHVAAYVPDAARSKRYDEMFTDYLALHDRFGRGDPLMRRLRARRHAAMESAHRVDATSAVRSDTEVLR